MGKALLKVLLTFIGNFVGAILAPIDLVIGSAFSDFTYFVNGAQTALTRISSYCGPYFGFVWALIPTPIQDAISYYLDTLIIIYTVNISIHLFIKIIKIIKNIKIWQFLPSLIYTFAGDYKRALKIS